jgi:diguanylate cyclase (GGDEF)-like protein
MKQMLTIPAKLLVTFVLGFGSMAWLSLTILDRNVTASYQTLEQNDLSMHMGQMRESLEAELAHLRSFSLDWAVWSEMYRYAQKPDATWAQENIGPQALQPANLSLVMIYNAQGKLLIQNSRDEQGRKLLLTDLQASPFTALFKAVKGPPGCGLIQTRAGLMLTCWARITRSDSSGDAAGTVVMGRALGPALIEKLSQQIKIPIKLQLQQALPPGLTRWPGAVSADAIGDGVFLTSHDASTYQIYYTLKDVLKQPLGFISMAIPRELHFQGEQLYRQVRLQLLLIALSTAIVLSLAVHWLLMRRLRSLTSQLAQLTAGAHWDARIAITGCDELTMVGTTVNQLLTLIEAQVKELKTLSLTDALTGLPNRRAFEIKLLTEYARAHRNSSPLALLALDADHFKLYNDYYGHPQGDVALKVMADVLRLSLGRPADVIARMGGEEFSVLLPETDAAGAQEIANRIIDNFRVRNLPHADSPVASYMTVSIGIAVAGDESQESFFSRADRALYRAKLSGRNRAFFEAQTALESDR